MAAVCLLLATVALSADDLSVQVDPHANLSSFKTFAIREGKLAYARPELDNPLFEKRLAKTIRAGLTAKGLKDTAASPDLVVHFTLTGEDVSIGVRGMVRGAGPQPRRSTQGTLVIDLTRPGEQTPVWRGVYRDDESTGSKLVEKLPEDAKKLIDRYPALPK